MVNSYEYYVISWVLYSCHFAKCSTCNRVNVGFVTRNAFKWAKV